MVHALIIEDELLIALEIQSLLEDLGYRSFEIAVSPAEAVASARRRRPDLVTADFRIREGAGTQAVRMIRAECGAVPVVYVTGNAAEVLGLGDPVVEKPVTLHDLRRACAEAGAMACSPSRRPS